MIREALPDSDTARTYLESVLWPSGPICHHCGTVGESTKLEGRSCRTGLYQCRICEGQYTVTCGTIFENTKVGLDKWMIAFSILCASKKSISALQMSRMLKLSYKSAWHMCHRIRHAMQNGNFKKLNGVVEVDETYVGGKAKNAHNGKPVPKKVPVVSPGISGWQHEGPRRYQRRPQDDQATLKRFVEPTAEIFTDGGTHFPAAVQGYAGHETVNHDAKEYVRGVVHIQGCESFNALLKRSLMGAWHRGQRKAPSALRREVAFRWDYRKVSDSERILQALKQAEGCRLTYRQCRKVNHEQTQAQAG